MRIPKFTARPRFYVATSDTTAFSSWGTLQEALECCQRFKKTYPEEYARIDCIVRVSGTQKTKLRKTGPEEAS